jgi:hypothetical protein
MESYAGFEPQVGEIRALRTFRIGPGGVLYPLFSDTAWSDGTNTASCTAPGSSDPGPVAHHAPDPDCTCGFYAYASEAGAAEYAYARHVLAVVACWGRVIAGTRGIRAEHGRIEAVWMSDTVPPDLAALVATRYPSTTPYSDKSAMLAAHPPTVLDCYETDPPRERTVKRWGLRLSIIVALMVGVLPTDWLGSNHDARVVWAGELCFFLIGVAILRRRRTDLAAKRRMLLFVAVALWLVAPFAGAVGVVMLRLPLIQVGALAVVQRQLFARAASQFPAEISAPERRP